MRDVAGFREAVRLRRRSAGRTQQQLARAIGVHPDVLSHKLNQRSGAMLTTAEVAAIVTTLADWAAIGSQDEARALLAMMAVPPNLLRALGLTPQSASAAEDQLIAALRVARLLLVADNMEHLVEQAPLLGRLLAAAPGLHLLVTSRVPLGLYGEHQLRVPPLHLPGPGDPAGSVAASEAVQLFVQRARAVAPAFEPHGATLTAAAAICAALDGLSLAIELAASWVKLYPPQALLPRLEARLSLLTGGPRDLPQRHQTLRATLDWSDALLPAATGELFARLGVFAGPFDAAAAAAVGGAGADTGVVLGRLAELAGHSLLEVTAADTPRFGLLATVREYALARLAETGQADQVHDRHLRYWLALATQARASLGEVARDSGEPGRARALFQQALRGHQQTGSKRGMAADLEGLAGVAALSGEDRCALVYFGAAQALREASGGPMLPAEHAILTRLLDAGSAPLTGADRDGALAEGRNRPLAQVIADALGFVEG